ASHPCRDRSPLRRLLGAAGDGLSQHGRQCSRRVRFGDAKHMSKLITGDGRTHIESSLMRESLVDRRVVAKTDSEGEFAIMPDVALVGIGGQSIFDRGKAAVMPVVEELRTLREARRSAGGDRKGPPPMVLGVGGGTRVRHTVSVAIDLGIPTGGVAQLVGAM